MVRSRKHITIFLVFLFSQYIFSSCASIGSKSYIHNDEEFKHIDCFNLKEIFITFDDKFIKFIENEGNDNPVEFLTQNLHYFGGFEYADYFKPFFDKLAKNNGHYVPLDYFKLLSDYFGGQVWEALYNDLYTQNLTEQIYLNQDYNIRFALLDDDSLYIPLDSTVNFINSNCIGNAFLLIKLHKTGANGGNTTALLELYSSSGSEKILTVTHNTMWGNNYTGPFPPSHYTTIQDAVEGVLKKTRSIFDKNK
ncbi:MAG: hypothetical protein ABIJ12_04490 [bacterium]